MACNEERSTQLGAVAGGRLGAETAGELLEHIATCSACSEEFDLVADLARSGSRARAMDVLVPLPPLQRVGMALALAAALLLVFALFDDGDKSTSRLRAMAQLAPPPSADSGLRGGDAQADEPRRRGLELYRAGDYSGACVLLSKVRELEPQDALACFYLGVSLVQMEEFEAALDALASAALAGEGLLQERALWYMANTQLAREDAPAAREALQRLMVLDGDYALNAKELLGQLEE